MATTIKQKDKDIKNLFNNKNLTYIIDDDMLAESQKVLDDISTAFNGGGFNLGVNNNGTINSVKYTLVKKDCRYGFSYVIKIEIKAERATDDTLLVFLDQHNFGPEYDVNYGVHNTSQINAMGQSFIKRQSNGKDHIVLSRNVATKTFSGIIDPSYGAWFATSCGDRGGVNSTTASKISGQSSGCGPHKNVPYIKDSDGLIAIKDYITEDGDGDPLDKDIRVVNPGVSYVNIPVRNLVNQVYYSLHEVKVNDTGDDIKVQNIVLAKSEKKINYSSKNKIQYEVQGDDGFGSKNKREVSELADGQNAKFTIPSGVLKTGKYYLLSFYCSNEVGFSNIVTTRIFRVSYDAPSILDETSVTVDDDNPLSGIKISAVSDSKIWTAQIKVTAKTKSNGDPIWEGAKVIDIIKENSVKKYVETIDLRDYSSKIPKNDDHTWYNTKYYVKIRVQADNLDYLWSSDWDTADVYEVKTKNIATFDSFPNMIMGQDKTPDVKIRVAKGVRYRIETTLPGSVKKNQPASITNATDTYTADKPLTVNGVSISSSNWDTIYKQLPGGIDDLTSTTTEDDANNLSVTAKIVSYYGDGTTKAGDKSLANTRTIALKNANSKVRTVRVRNSGAIKAGMVYIRENGVIKKGVVWIKSNNSKRERGVINGDVV